MKPVELLLNYIQTELAFNLSLSHQANRYHHQITKATNKVKTTPTDKFKRITFFVQQLHAHVQIKTFVSAVKRFCIKIGGLLYSHPLQQLIKPKVTQACLVHK